MTRSVPPAVYCYRVVAIDAGKRGRMEKVLVKRTELLKKVTNNREQHREIFLEAQEGYRKAVIKELDAMLGDAREGKPIRRTVQLVEPMDQTRDYDRVIAMLSMSVQDEIELGEENFAQYVLDDWSWKGRFLMSSSSYSDKARRLS